MIAVIVPVYKELSEETELLSFLRLIQICHDDIFLVYPDGLNVGAYCEIFPELKLIPLPKENFLSISSYNRLMLCPNFYELFVQKYEWILIHQLDAFLFEYSPEYFTNLEYDYFGAPWLPGQYASIFSSDNKVLFKIASRKLEVGNGGLSLRRLKPTIKLLKIIEKLKLKWLLNEDALFGYFSFYGSFFKVCPLSVAARFSVEHAPIYLYNLYKIDTSMGCHAFNKINEPFYENFTKKHSYLVKDWDAYARKYIKS